MGWLHGMQEAQQSAPRPSIRGRRLRPPVPRSPTLWLGLPAAHGMASEPHQPQRTEWAPSAHTRAKMALRPQMAALVLRNQHRTVWLASLPRLPLPRQSQRGCRASGPGSGTRRMPKIKRRQREAPSRCWKNPIANRYPTPANASERTQTLQCRSARSTPRPPSLPSPAAPCQARPGATPCPPPPHRPPAGTAHLAGRSPAPPLQDCSGPQHRHRRRRGRPRWALWWSRGTTNGSHAATLCSASLRCSEAAAVRTAERGSSTASSGRGCLKQLCQPPVTAVVTTYDIIL
mmetsp:Transcript_16595/g.29076  ORF Transcript_16595/g.29076 Transcript_16595/m.29076 type:complete len:289 (+) Transcript_16595:273-1139(+)